MNACLAFFLTQVMTNSIDGTAFVILVIVCFIDLDHLSDTQNARKQYNLCFLLYRKYRNPEVAENIATAIIADFYFASLMLIGTVNNCQIV
jgi:hypothetical protein